MVAQPNSIEKHSLIPPIPPGLVILNPDGRMEFVNADFARLLGCTPADLSGQVIEGFFSQSSAAILAALSAASRTDQVVGHANLDLRRRDGTETRLRITVIPRLDSGTWAGLTLLAEIPPQTSSSTAETLIQFASDGIVLIAQTAFTYASPAVEHLLGFSPAELLQQLPAERIHPEDRPAFQAVLDQFGPSPLPTFRFLHKDGSWRWLSGALNPFPAAGTRTVILTLHDITTQKQTEKKLHESQDWLRLTHDIANLGTWQHHVAANLFQMDERCQAHYGSLTEFASDEQFLATVHPDDLSFIADTMAKALSPGNPEPGPIEYRVIHPDGSVHWLLVRLRVKVDASPEKRPVLTIGVTQDITERKRIEEDVLLLSRVVEQTADTVVITNCDGDIEYVNAAYEKISGFSKAETLSAHRNLLQSSTNDLRFSRDLWNTILTGQVFLGEVPSLKKNGDLYYEAKAITPIRDEHGNVTHFVSTGKDISERIRAEEQIHRHAKETDALYEISLKMIAELDVPDLLQGVVEQAVNLLGAPMGGLYLMREDGETLELVVSYNLPGNIKGTCLRLGEGLSGRIAQTGVYEMVEDYSRWVGKADVYAQIQFKRVLGVPLKIGSRVLGVLNITDSQRTGSYSSDEVRLISLFADMAAIVVEKNRLYLLAQRELEARMLTEQQLRQNAANMNAAQRLGHIGSWEFQLEPSLELIDPALCSDETYQILGLQPGAQPFTMAFMFNQVHPDDRDIVWKTHQRTRLELTETSLEYRIILPDGSIRHILKQSEVICDEKSGQPLKMIGLLQDITARKMQEEREIQHREDIYQALLENTNDAIVLISTDDARRVNHKALLLSGYSAAELQKIDLYDLIDAGERAALVDKVSAVQQGQAVPLFECGLITRSGKRIEVEINLSAIRDPNAPEPIVQVVARDITPRKQAEALLQKGQETLQLANAELERGLRMKDEFLANMSHELRTPLTAILGLSECLEGQLYGPLNDQQLHYSQVIRESGRHLLNLINDILDLSKIEAGKMELELVKFPLQSVIETSLRMVKEIAQQKKQQISTSIDPQVQYLDGDERRLKQMVVNLLSNAIKFTPKGGSIGLVVEGQAQLNQMSIAVWDTGIGIEQKDLHRLFQPFVQLDAGLSREQSGTGLGLSMVSRIASLHGGSVKVESEPGRGSRFTITLPWKYAPDESEALPRKTRTGPLSSDRERNHRATVLVVDDTEISLMVISDYLKALGFRIATAQRGVDAIYEARQVRPDLILMDIQMPGMDGIETTRLLRLEPGLEKTPIIALTALAMAGDRERCLDAGMNDYISKPVSMKFLAALIQKHLQAPGLS